MGGFCLLVELHREGPALQPARQAGLLNDSNLTLPKTIEALLAPPTNIDLGISQ